MTKYVALLFLVFSCRSNPPEDLGPPTLGARIYDRVGRAAINTALIGLVSPKGVRNGLQDRYNVTPEGAWSEFAGEIGANLAIYDALDGVCGNQLLAGPSAVAGRYDALASALADDRLYVDTSAGACNQYFAVELGVSGDCGGRTPAYDVIDVTYSALAVGATSGVPDGIDSDPAQLPPDFPYFRN
jgi:hypothetical protein